VGKQENCPVAVSLSVATWSCSLPIAYRLYLPKDWAEDAARREKAEVPEEVVFQTKPEIALEQIRTAVAAQVARGVILADAAYGINTEFRDRLTQLDLQYVVGVQSSMTVWEPGKQPLPAKPRGKMGRPPRLLQRSADHQPISVKQLAMSLPSSAFRQISWREGTERKLRSRFAAVRVRAAHRDYEKAEPHAEEWLVIEWPRSEPEPTKHWMSTLSPDTLLKDLVKMAKHRWIIGMSSQGHIVQSVRDRPRLRDSSLVAWEVPWRESKTAEPSDNILRKECAQRTRLQRAVNADVASLHEFPVAETVYNARKQQELTETSPKRQLSPAGYQRRHGVKDGVETGEALGARRRNLIEEMPAITASGKCRHRHQGGGSGRSTFDGRAAKRDRREGPGPVSIPSVKARQG
jgi:hypothetical protein